MEKRDWTPQYRQQRKELMRDLDKVLNDKPKPVTYGAFVTADSEAELYEKIVNQPSAVLKNPSSTQDHDRSS
jgi:hypothetical protein